MRGVKFFASGSKRKQIIFSFLAVSLLKCGNVFLGASAQSFYSLKIVRNLFWSNYIYFEAICSYTNKKFVLKQLHLFCWAPLLLH
jgi:hypothetical protein